MHSPFELPSLRAGVIGLGVQLLFVPVLIVLSIGLAVTIIGIPFVAILIPFALVTMFLAMLLGFTSLAHTVGGWAAGRLGWDAQPAIWVAVLGLALIVLPTVLSRIVGVAPDALRAAAFALLAIGTTVEYVAWTIGLGAAASRPTRVSVPASVSQRAVPPRSIHDQPSRGPGQPGQSRTAA